LKHSPATGAPIPFDERARLEALRRYRVLDTSPEDAFDDLIHAAALLCRTPIALLSLVDATRQWFKARKGIPSSETSRRDAFCAYAILGSDLMVVQDTHSDSRFVENALVTGEPHIRFYAGAPVVTPDGFGLGTLCVIDRVPRSIGDEESRALRGLARQAMIQLELRRTILEVDSVSDPVAVDHARREGELRLRHLLGYPRRTAP
jgi:GAF domain-containing protein